LEPKKIVYKQLPKGKMKKWATLYPKFAEVATVFNLIVKVEAENELKYLKLLQNISEGKVLSGMVRCGGNV